MLVFYNMGNKTLITVLKVLKWAVLVCLIIVSCWFMSGVWQKFTANVTNFRTYQEKRAEYPTTTLCFAPFAKHTVLEKYNLTRQQLGNSLKIPISWKEFQDEAFYKLGRDFDIFFGDIFNIFHTLFGYYNSKKLVEGSNIISDKNIIHLEKILTFRSGICYKITQKIFSYQELKFSLEFNQSLQEKDIPLAEIYLTSEENAIGVLVMNWPNGDELKFDVNGLTNEYKLKTVKHIYLDLKSKCKQHYFNSCLTQILVNANYSYCTNTCMPVTLPEFESINVLPPCVSLEDYNCMLWRMQSLLSKTIENENCPLDCSVLEYKGRRIIQTQSQKTRHQLNIWTYTFASKYTEVHEEYLIYDTEGLIGSVGGTLSLFIGFSFWNIIHHVIEYSNGLINVNHRH